MKAKKEARLRKDNNESESSSFWNDSEEDKDFVEQWDYRKGKYKKIKF